MVKSVSKAYSVLLFTEMGVEHKCASGRTAHVSWTRCEEALQMCLPTAMSAGEINQTQEREKLAEPSVGTGVCPTLYQKAYEFGLK